jgi:UDP-N-acetylmuramate dehydrogenase
LEYPSAGSIFKRPVGHFAGKLVEDCGWKGKSVGGAQVSEKHAGFIINTGGATACDVRALISQIRADVLQKKGVLLECEVRYIGTDGDIIL